MGATLEVAEPQPCTEVGATVWFRLTAPAGGEIVADTIGSTFDTVLAAYPSGDDTPLACNDDAAPGDLLSEITFPVAAGQTYELQAGGFAGDTGKLVLNVQLLVPPANDHRADGTVITDLPDTRDQSTANATLEAGEPEPCSTIGASVWFRVTATRDGVIVADTFGSDFDTVLAAYPLGDDVSVACNDDSGSLQSEIQFGVLMGQTYEFQVAGYHNHFTGQIGTGNLKLNVSLEDPLVGDMFGDAIQVAPPMFQHTINTAQASREAGEPHPSCTFAGAPVGRTIWYRFDAALGGQVATSLSSDFDTVIAVYEQTSEGLGGLEEVACNDDAVTTRQSAALVIPVEPGNTYYIQVGGWREASGTLRFTFVGN